MTSVLACIDRSAYANAVCDHAAWLAGTLATDLDVLHVDEAAGAWKSASDVPRSNRLLRRARERVADHGVQARHLRLDFGSVIEAVTAAAPGTAVLGKRGEHGAARRDRLGSNAAALLRGRWAGLCLVSQVYFPVRRALVLIDDDPRHRSTVETVVAHPALRELELEVVLAQPNGHDVDPKLAWAREMFGGRADVFALAAITPDAAAAQRLEERTTDLIVVSRQMLLAQGPALATPLEARAIWSLRAPLFIC